MIWACGAIAHSFNVKIKSELVSPISLLSGPACACVFLDVGSNVGVHVRKLYEPGRYNRSPYTGIFEKVFGQNGCGNRDAVCSVAFEANPAHHLRQQMLVRHNQQRSRNAWAVNAAVGPPTGWLTFQSGYASGETIADHEAWGFGLNTKNGSGPHAEVYAISLSQFVLRYLHRPQLVLMKMDIEGGEYAVLDDMVESGAVKFIDTMTAEFHRGAMSPQDYGDQKRTWKAKLAAHGCTLEMIDDESDLHDPVPLQLDLSFLGPAPQRRTPEPESQGSTTSEHSPRNRHPQSDSHSRQTTILADSEKAA